MSKKPTKAADNRFCIARMEAASFNEKLNSREGAAEVSGIDRTRLARIELGSLVPYPEEVLLLSDTYNVQELPNWYCSNLCPIGKLTITEVKLKEIFELTVQLCSTLKDAPLVKEELLDIVADGTIAEAEKPQLNEILSTLDNISNQTAALKMWVQKNIK